MKYKMMVDKFKKLSTYKKILIIYSGVLIIFLISFLIYVRSCLALYENNQIDTYMHNLITKMGIYAKKGSMSKYIDYEDIKVSELENKTSTINDGYKYLFEKSKMTYKKVSTSEDKKKMIYQILANDKEIFTVTVLKGKEIHRMGLLTFNLLKTESVKANLDRGLYYYDIIVPSGFSVIVNGHVLTPNYITKQEVDTEFSKEEYSSSPKNITYSINDLIYKPYIEILNNDSKEVSYEEKGYVIKNTSLYTTDNKETAMSKLVLPYDALTVAKDWSLFLTDDLVGNNHGFDTIKKYLVKDSYMWNMAYQWATGVDIKFVSKHYLKNPIFTNEGISNFTIYNQNAFSCTVYLEKNMSLLPSGRSKVDIMNDRLYFIYYDDPKDDINGPTWKLVNMKAVTVE